MATIYDTPVILLKKPDTSEQWILNSTVTIDEFKTLTASVNFISNNETFDKIQIIGG